jgi:hypothetical protein
VPDPELATAAGWQHEDFPLAANRPADEKWLRIRNLLAGADSVEVFAAPSGYTLRVWTPPAEAPED